MSVPSTTTAVVRAHADAYDIARPALMGRQSAGHGFLRALVRARGAHPVYGFDPAGAGLAEFDALVKTIDPAATTIGSDWKNIDPLVEVGVLFLADPALGAQARRRLRSGSRSYSLCGITHTLAEASVIDELTALLRDPVEPWDALICTSTAAAETVRRVHEAEEDYLRWRFGPGLRIARPYLPVIPLGVHCDDFAGGYARRDGARAAHGIADQEVVALFVGRLVFHAKAHPFAMYRGLQAAAAQTGRRITLLLCGKAPNQEIRKAFADGAARFAPDVRVVFLDGRDAVVSAQAWAAADFFISLSDNIQETFGLTPVEAMAAGLPVVVSDWNGYRDTVRHGIDGFRIRTLAPAADAGEILARAYEAEAINYDHYCGHVAATTAVDLDDLTAALVTLVEDPDLRRRLGQAGLARAREVFDWTVVFRSYQELWDELNARRTGAQRGTAAPSVAPSCAADALDPFHMFGHYPTARIAPDSCLSAAPGMQVALLADAYATRLFDAVPVAQEFLHRLFLLVAAGDTTVARAAASLHADIADLCLAAGALAKLGMIRVTASGP